MRTTLNGIEIAYTDEREGTALLLVHGFPLNRLAWIKQWAGLKASHRVIAPDLRGFGESGATNGPVAMSRYAEDLMSLIHHLRLGPVTLVGHSMGGYIALAFAAAYPQALHGLVLVSTKSAADNLEVAAARRKLAERVREEGVGIVIDDMAPRMLSAGNANTSMAEEVRGLMAPSKPLGIISALQGMADRPNMASRLGLIRVPTLVISGTEDAVIPPSESEALAKAIAGAQLELIPNGGHLVAFECAEAFNKALSDWMAARRL